MLEPNDTFHAPVEVEAVFAPSVTVTAASTGIGSAIVETGPRVQCPKCCAEGLVAASGDGESA
jgi:hypothetical protein